MEGRQQLSMDVMTVIFQQLKVLKILFIL